MSKNQIQSGVSYLENAYKAQATSSKEHYFKSDSIFSSSSSVKQDAWMYSFDDTIEEEQEENK